MKFSKLKLNHKKAEVLFVGYHLAVGNGIAGGVTPIEGSGSMSPMNMVLHLDVQMMAVAKSAYCQLQLVQQLYPFLIKVNLLSSHVVELLQHTLLRAPLKNGIEISSGSKCSYACVDWDQ